MRVDAHQAHSDLLARRAAGSALEVVAKTRFRPRLPSVTVRLIGSSKPETTTGTPMTKTTASILSDAREILATARLGLGDLVSGQPERRLPGLRNLIVFGRSVTLVLQNLRSTEPAFDDWYAPHQEVMRNDPLMRYLVELRNEILKEGSMPTRVGVYIGQLDGSNLFNRLPPRPAGATNFFIGDQTGGSGWMVTLPDGQTEKYYVALPADIGYVYNLRLTATPDVHLGSPITDKSVENVGRLYLAYLEGLVRDAEREFGHA